MCGLAGVAGHLTTVEKKVFNQLMHTAYLRGDAAAGVAGINPTTNSYKIWKHAMPVYDVMGHQNWDTAANLSADIFMGHTRQPTVGANTKFNAQPFVAEGTALDMIGTHNGTITGRAHKIDEYKTYGTDSEALMNHIANHGIYETIKEAMWKDDDKCAYALVWYEFGDKTIHMIRNEERPLCYVFSKDMKQLFWASESLQLIWILSRNNIQFDNVKHLAPHQHVIIKMRNPAGTFEHPKTYSCEPKETKPPVVTTYTGQYQVGGSGQLPFLPTSQTNSGTGGSASTIRSLQKVDNLEENFRDFKKKGDKWRPPYRDHLGLILQKDKVFDAWDHNTCCMCDMVYLTDASGSNFNTSWGAFALFLREDENRHRQWMCEDCCKDEKNFLAVKAALG